VLRELSLVGRFKHFILTSQVVYAQGDMRTNVTGDFDQFSEDEVVWWGGGGVMLR
jgi:hypothetical protein